MIDKDTIMGEVDEWMEQRPHFEAEDEENQEMMDIFKNIVPIRPYAEYETELTNDQKLAMQSNANSAHKQIFCSVTGDAGKANHI